MIVKGTNPMRGIARLDIFPDIPWTAYIDLKAPPLPEKKLAEALGVREVCAGSWMIFGKHRRLKARYRPIGPFHPTYQRHTLPHSGELRLEGAVGQNRRPETLVQGWQEPGFDKPEISVHKKPFSPDGECPA